MAQLTTIHRDFNEGFIIDEAKLRKIVNLIQDHCRKLSTEPEILIWVDRKNDLSSRTSDLEEIFKEDNSPAEMVTRLKIQARKPKDEGLKEDPLAVLDFWADGTPHVRLMIHGPTRDWCYLLGDDLDAQIKRLLRKKVWKILSFKALDSLGAIVVSFSALPYLIPFTSRASIPTATQISSMTMEQQVRSILEIVSDNRAPSFKVPLLMICMFLMMVLFLEFRPLSRLINKLCQSYFSWGDMSKIVARNERIVSFLVGTVIVGFCISLAATFTSERLHSLFRP